MRSSGIYLEVKEGRITQIHIFAETELEENELIEKLKTILRPALWPSAKQFINISKNQKTATHKRSIKL